MTKASLTLFSFLFRSLPTKNLYGNSEKEFNNKKIGENAKLVSGDHATFGSVIYSFSIGS